LIRLAFAFAIAAQFTPGMAGERAFRDLIRHVNDAAAGRPAPRDFTPALQFHFQRAKTGTVFVSMVVALPTGTPPAQFAEIYVRGYARGAVPETVQLEPVREREGYRPSMRVFPIENAAVIPLELAMERAVSRGEFAFSAPSGTFTIHGAIRERTTAKARTAVFSEAITLPDFGGTRLAASSVILAERTERVDPNAKAGAYTLGNVRAIPALDNTFDADRPLSALLVVYNANVDGSGKPDLNVEFAFFALANETATLVTRTRPQELTAATLPPAFDLNKGHQLVAGQEVSLRAFERGDYRIDVTVTDRRSGQSIVQSERFRVAR
jgi:hypothetical protein